jgi:hypothetical protein
MTAFGKLLVFVQFILSMVFTTWAVILYSQSMEWAPAKTLMGEPIPDSKGRVGELGEQIKGIVGDGKESSPRDKAEFRWQTAYAGFDEAAKSRDKYKAWYSDQLKLIKTGEDTAGRRQENPVRHLVYNPDGTLKTDPKDRPPVQSFGNALKSIDDYYKESAGLQKDIETAQDQLYKTVQEAADITADIVGSKSDYGLRRKLRDEEEYFRNAHEEYRFLKPIYDGLTAEFEVVKNRNAQLERRKQELTAAAANR